MHGGSFLDRSSAIKPLNQFVIQPTVLSHVFVKPLRAPDLKKRTQTDEPGFTADAGQLSQFLRQQDASLRIEALSRWHLAATIAAAPILLVIEVQIPQPRDVYAPLWSYVPFNAATRSAQQHDLVVRSGWKAPPETRRDGYSILGVHSMNVVADNQSIGCQLMNNPLTAKVLGKIAGNPAADT